MAIATREESLAALKQHLGSVAGYSPDTAARIADASTAHSQNLLNIAGQTRSVTDPTADQQACYAKCEQDRDADLAAAAAKGFPGAWLAAGAAILKFNACRAGCDSAS